MQEVSEQASLTESMVSTVESVSTSQEAWVSVLENAYKIRYHGLVWVQLHVEDSENQTTFTLPMLDAKDMQPVSRGRVHTLVLSPFLASPATCSDQGLVWILEGTYFFFFFYDPNFF